MYAKRSHIMKKGRLIREQLEIKLQVFKPLANTRPPQKGWIRAIRDALGMTAKQLASKMGISQQAVARIEKDESDGAVTIKTMQRIAEALDCNFVYGFAPRVSLNTTIRNQAHKVAGRRLAQVNQTMVLEAQSLNRDENKKVLNEMVDELIEKCPRNLWKEL
jgi:predicted DNA-binding mobile mystery protein A